MINDWTENYIELWVPTYDQNKLVQYGQLFINRLIPTPANNRADLKVKVLSGFSDVDKPTASGYKDDAYRYLLNASLFRYNQKRTSATHGQESTRMQWVSDYLKSIGRGIDATWSMILAYALVYGGYSEEAIKKEIKHGPGCVHAFIESSIWSGSTDAKKCLAKAL